MKKVLEVLVRTFVLGALVVRCATNADSGSQTHWLAVCSRDADCGQGLVCRCGRCMKTCTGDTCAGLPRAADCVAPGSPAHDALCEALTGDSVCLARCGSGCLSGEQCVSEACVPLVKAAVEAGADGRPSDGSPCSNGQVLVYETPGCNAKPVCDGPSFDACAMQACGCDGVTLSGGCGVFDKPFAHTGPCVAGRPDANPSDGPADALACPGFQVLIYPTPGCNGLVKPICEGPSFDACATKVCGCDGVTQNGCGDWRKPWAHMGNCEDGGD